MKEKKTYIQPLMEDYPLHLATAVCSGGGLQSTPEQPTGDPEFLAPKRLFY